MADDLNILIFLILIGASLLLFLPLLLIVILLVINHKIRQALDILKRLEQRIVTLEERKIPEKTETLPEQTPGKKRSPISPAPTPAAASVIERPTIKASTTTTQDKKTKTEPGKKLKFKSSQGSTAERKTSPQQGKKAPEKHQADNRKLSSFEQRANDIFKRIWSWIVVGEEFRNPDVSIEYAVATSWLTRIAIVILVSSVVAFLKYSIDEGYLGDRARVALSILAGLTMLATGVKMAGKKYHIIAQGLLGGGIATLYGAVFAGYRMFNVFTATPAFAIMILITIAAGALAVRMNSLLVAVLGVVGGYATPFLIHSDKGSPTALLAYTLILGVCALAIAKHRDWKLLNALAFTFTWTIAFLTLDLCRKPSLFPSTMAFISAFFLLFSYLTIRYNLIHKIKSTIIEMAFVTINAALFFVLGYILIENEFGRRYVSILTISLAAFHIAQIYFFVKTKLEDRNYLVVLSGTAAFFITYTAPLLLSDNWITAAWAFQALAFMWVSSKLGSSTVRAAANILFILALGRLFFCDFQHDFINAPNDNYWMEMLTRLTSFGSVVISLAGAYAILKKEGERDASNLSEIHGVFHKNDIPLPGGGCSAPPVFLWSAILFLFLYSHFEVDFFTGNFYPSAKMTALSFIWIAAIVLVATIIRKRENPIALKAVLAILSLGLILKMIFFDLAYWRFQLEDFAYAGTYSPLDAIMRLLDFLPAAAVFAFASLVIPRHGDGETEKKTVAGKHFAIISVATLFIYSTFEANTFLAAKAPGLRSGGVSILWSLFATAFILAGIRKKLKAIRYLGLILFAVVAAKVFLFDIGQLSQIYKIIALVALGLIILGGAFIYIRFKDSFENTQEDEEKK